MNPSGSDTNVDALVDALAGPDAGAALIALAPVLHDPGVFDVVMALVERPADRTVQEPMWSKLFSAFSPETYVVPRLDGKQLARCAHAMIAIELTHPQIHARNAAGQALHRFSPRSIERVLIAALGEHAARYAAMEGEGAALDHGKSERDQLEAVTANLYNAVVGLGTPGARLALVERLFDERRSFWPLGAAIGQIFDAELHLAVLAALARRRDGRAVGCYAYALAEHVEHAPALVELGQLLADWPIGDEATRGDVAYALVVCEVAALAAHDTELVRKIERARAAILVEPKCPAARWRDPFDEVSLAASLAYVMSGDADREKARLVVAGATARAAGTPQLAITDGELGLLAGTTVALRLHVDRVTGEIWFRDAALRVFVFDGYEIVEPPFEAVATPAELLEGIVAIDEREMWWDELRTHYREVLRLEDRVILSWGKGGANPAQQLLRFPTRAAAVLAMEALRANVSSAYTPTGAYYVPGKGAIVRTYYVPAEGGLGHNEREPIWVQGTDPAAILEHAQRELSWMRDRGGTLTCVDHSPARRRREDLSVREWIATRFRDDAQDAIWHLEAFDELAAYLDAHGLRAALPELDLQLGAPASDEDIDALDAERAHPVPTSLRLLWRAHGRASWKLGADGRRLLGPREVLARRAATRADVIVESLAGAPVTFLGDFARDDGHVFAHAVADSGEPHWDASLAWSIATRLVGDLEVALVTAAPILGELRYGQRTERQERGVYLEKDGAFWDAVVDLDAGVATVRVGPIDHVGETLIERIEPGTAEAWLDAKAAQRWALGYRNPPPAKPVKPAKPAKPKASARAPTKRPAKAPKPAAKARKVAPKATPKATPPKAVKASPRAIKKSPPKRAVRSKRTSK